jgi:hypothetical protein
MAILEAKKHVKQWVNNERKTSEMFAKEKELRIEENVI